MTEHPRKAIVLVSFGVSYPETRAKTIDALERLVKEEYPGYKVVTAFTSEMIRHKLQRRGDVTPPNTDLALQELAREGYTHIYLQATHLIAGFEYEKMLGQLEPHRRLFKKIAVGDPLLAHPQDYARVARIMHEEYAPENDEALVLMGHGTEHYINAAYPALGYEFMRQGMDNVQVGTVEGYPSLDDVVSRLKTGSYARVHLAPLLFVAGDHAQNDMAGDEDDSWKNVLLQAGYEVVTHVRGMGEIAAVQRLYLEYLARIVE